MPYEEIKFSKVNSTATSTPQMRGIELPVRIRFSTYIRTYRIVGPDL